MCYLSDRGGHGVAWNVLPRLRATYVRDMLVFRDQQEKPSSDGRVCQADLRNTWECVLSDRPVVSVFAQHR